MANQMQKNLIINYLPQHMSDRELYSMFVTIGPIDQCRVMKDIKTGYSYGYGFVNFSRPEDAERAIQQLNGLEVFNKRIKVSFARPTGEEIKDTNLYITNLPKHYTEADLEELFGSFGNIVQKHLLLDKITGMKRGVGFVRFNRKEEAQEAIRNLDGCHLEGSNEPLSVKIAEEHGKKRAAYYAGWQAGVQQSRGGGFGVSRGRGGSSRNSLHMNPSFGLSGGQENNLYNNQVVSYPIRNGNALGARSMRQGKQQSRYNPIAFDYGFP